MRLSKLTLDCLKSLRPSRVRVVESWAVEWDNRQWSEYETLLESLQAENPGADRRLFDYLAGWWVERGKPDAGALLLDRLAQDLRAARAAENGVAGLKTCFSCIDTGGIRE